MSLLQPTLKTRLHVGTLPHGKQLHATRWRQSLCVLMDSPPSAGPSSPLGCPTIYIFRAEDSTAPLAVLPLRSKHVRMRTVHSSLFDRHHAFELLTASEAYFFQCGHAEEFSTWLEVSLPCSRHVAVT